MCGIVGYIGRREAADAVVEGLKMLEYRGYDSFGLSTLDTHLCTRKTKGRISECDPAFLSLSGNLGIGHTRWATHGVPDIKNAHPHSDCTGRIAIVHNGIIENYASLKKELTDRGHRFLSDTDSEVIAHLIEEHYTDDLLKAVEEVLPCLTGSYAILAIAEGNRRLIAARKNSPLVIGLGDGEFIASSDVTPIMTYTKNVIFMEDGDIAALSDDGVIIKNTGTEVVRDQVYIDWDCNATRKGGFENYMLKEIYEQPEAFYRSVHSVEEEGLPEVLMKAPSLSVLACGTSYHAALVFRYLAGAWCDLPVRVELASEARYFSPAPGEVVLAATQSGETADTITALRRAQELNCPTLAITNVLGSSVTRVADHTIYMQAGPEISVAATKSYIAQLAVFFSIADQLSGRKHRDALMRVHQVIEQVLLLDGDDSEKLCSKASSIFFVGRGSFYPVALEGALKMKEITYIHAEGYAAGELKHGPFSLLSEETPVVAICPEGESHDGMISSLKEMKARGAPIIGVGTEGDQDAEDIVDLFIPIPHTDLCGNILGITVVLQCLAYYTAKLLGRDIDKPRNLAKSVTVE